MKHYSKLAFVFFLFPFLIASNCNPPDNSEDCHTYYTFKNNSDKTIRLTTSVAYPDSTLLEGIGVTSSIVSSHEAIKEKYGDCIEGRLNLINKDGVIMVFLFDEEIFKRYSIAEIKEKQMWLKKYDMRLEDFQEMNWIITYP